MDVDGTLPNLALMKLSRCFKAQGRKVALARGVKELPRAGTVLASCVFSTAPSAMRVEILRRRYGAAVQVGGSGVDLRLRLAPDIEALAPDYSLYPELGDRALGFLTRGCPRRCPFCVVPVKEGAPRQVSDLDTLLQDRQKLVLLDDNLLAHPSALGLLEEMARRDLAVNFNQTLDVRMLRPIPPRCCAASVAPIPPSRVAITISASTTRGTWTLCGSGTRYCKRAGGTTSSSSACTASTPAWPRT